MTTMQIPISKGVDLSIEIDLGEITGDDFPQDVYKEILFQGLKQVLNRGQSKEASSKGMPEAKQAENNARLLAKVQETLEACRKGEIRVTGGKSKSKITGEVKTEAMRLARVLVKDALKAAGKKVSHIAAKEITEAAKGLIDGEYGPEIIEQARVTIEARQKEETKLVIDVSRIKADPNLVAAAEKKHKKEKAPKAPPPVRGKPGAAQHTAH